MVAISGAGWRLAPSLVALIDECNRRWPDRLRVSDGSIGDADHAAKTSDHNPAPDGYVHAVDVTEDDTNGPNLVAFWDQVVDRRDHRVKYLIYEGRIVKSYVDSAGRPAWVAQPYTGVNAHTHHLHVSVQDDDTAETDTGPWWPDEGDDMFTDDDRALLGLIRQNTDILGDQARATDGAVQTALTNTNLLGDQLRAVHADLGDQLRELLAQATPGGAPVDLDVLADKVVDALVARLSA